MVEVAPAYDHAEMTTVAAAHVCYELLALLAVGTEPDPTSMIAESARSL